MVFNAWATLGGGVRFQSGAHLECWEAEVRLTRKSRHSRDGALSSALGNNQAPRRIRAYGEDWPSSDVTHVHSAIKNCYV